MEGALNITKRGAPAIPDIFPCDLYSVWSKLYELMAVGQTGKNDDAIECAFLLQYRPETTY
jgi:hypothetical protein